MDDLLDLDWAKSSSSSSSSTQGPARSSPNAAPTPPGYSSTSNYNFDALTRSMPAVGARSQQPRSQQQPSSASISRPAQSSTATAAPDAFSSLLSFGGGGGAASAQPSTTSMSMSMAQQQQKQQFKQAPIGDGASSGWGGANDGWDAFESGSTATKSAPPKAGAGGTSSQSSAHATQRDAPATSSTRPSKPASSDPFDFDDFTPSNKPTRRNDPFDFEDFEDPGQAQSSAFDQDGDGDGDGDGAGRAHVDFLDSSHDNEDDLLGALGRPVQAKAAAQQPQPQRQQQRKQASQQPPRPSPARTASPPPHLLGRIVEMGFSPIEARDALAKTTTGLDVEAALEMLLGGAAQQQQQQADRDYAQSLQQRIGDDPEMEEYEKRERERARARGRRVDPEQSQQPHQQQRQPPRRPTNGQADDAAADFDWQKQADVLYSQASEFSASMFTKANAFWSSAKTQAQRALEESSSSGRNSPGTVSNEASGRSSPAVADSVAAARAWARRWGTKGPPSQQQGAAGARDGRPRWMVEAEERVQVGTEQAPAAAAAAAAAPTAPTAQAEAFKDSDDEDEPAPPFIPPASRSVTADPVLPPRPADAKGTSAPPVARPSAPAPRKKAPPPRTKAAPAPSATAPKKDRQIIAEDLQAAGRSAEHKETGNAAFKKGAYGEAEVAYTAALDTLNQSSLRRIPLLNNRANARLKNGDASAASRDCTAVLALIVEGSSGGNASVLYEASSENPLPGALATEINLRDAYGKALSRRAQASEMLERWLPAMKDWTLLERYEKEQGSGASSGFRNLKSAQEGVKRCKGMVSGGGGGSGGSSKPVAAASHNTTTSRQTQATRKAATAAAASAIAKAEEAGLQRVRAITAAQQAEEAAAHSLKDSIDAQINTWKAGKETNIRALLASLENVVWPELGWKKVGMHEVITDAQVKKHYTRAMVKLHPDKLTPKTTTLEHRLIGSAAFTVLNEAFVAMQK